MKLRVVKVKNFRCLSDIDIPIDDISILVGENNTGKTALLDAIQIALRAQANRLNPFDEYDYHILPSGESTQTSDGILIELWFREDKTDEWPESIIQALNEIIQTEPASDIDSIGLRVTSKKDPITNNMVSRWEFLAIDGQPVKGKGAKAENISRFLQYIRYFYLSALRDSDDEFTSKSKYWGRLIRDLKVSEEKQKSLAEEFSKLNAELLKADSRIEQVIKTFENINKVMALETGGSASIQAVPLKPWELLSKSEVVIQARGSKNSIPLAKHGHGLKNLAVLFLFQAYVDVVLKNAYEAETEAILALEEPETHLHPQAIRSLATNLGEVKGQKIISTHSPYFIQEIPFRHLKIFRRDGTATKILYIESSFKTILPVNAALQTFCTQNPVFKCIPTTSVLEVSGIIDEATYRKLLAIFPADPETHEKIKLLKSKSQLYLDENELGDLERYIKRLRGDILFARAWILCEGQSEYLLMKYFSDVMKLPLDRYGVAVIDYQNNGAPGSFIAVAKIFEIPWLMICDNDDGGKDHIKNVEKRGVSTEEKSKRIRILPGEGNVLENYLINSYKQECVEVARKRGISVDSESGTFTDEMNKLANEDKVRFVMDLIETLKNKNINESNVPDVFKKAIKEIIEEIK